jgi:hypothetical protein
MSIKEILDCASNLDEFFDSGNHRQIVIDLIQAVHSDYPHSPELPAAVLLAFNAGGAIAVDIAKRMTADTPVPTEVKPEGDSPNATT